MPIRITASWHGSRQRRGRSSQLSSSRARRATHGASATTGAVPPPGSDVSSPVSSSKTTCRMTRAYAGSRSWPCARNDDNRTCSSTSPRSGTPDGPAMTAPRKSGPGPRPARPWKITVTGTPCRVTSAPAGKRCPCQSRVSCSSLITGASPARAISRGAARTRAGAAVAACGAARASVRLPGARISSPMASAATLAESSAPAGPASPTRALLTADRPCRSRTRPAPRPASAAARWLLAGGRRPSPTR